MLLSASQVLAIEPTPPPHFPGPPSAPSEPPHDSRNYGPITPYALTHIPSCTIANFRAYISSIYTDFSAISPSLPTCLPGLLLQNEADVRLFLDSQIITPVWPVILAMLPDPPTRDYDWLLCSERASSVSDNTHILPDKTFLKLSRRLDAFGNETLLSDSIIIIEYKAPGLVSKSSPVCNNDYNNDYSGGGGNSGSDTDTPNYPDGTSIQQVWDWEQTYDNKITNNWAIMTSQLRKSAQAHNCRHLVLIDELTAFYFHLPNLIDESNCVDFVTANSPLTSKASPTVGSPAGTDHLTVRELIAFAAWNALNDTQNTRLKSYSGDVSMAENKPPEFRYEVLFESPSLPTAPTAPRRRRRSITKPKRPERGRTILSEDITLKLCYMISLDHSDYGEDDIGPRYSIMLLPQDDKYLDTQGNEAAATLYLGKCLSRNMDKMQASYSVIQELAEDVFVVKSSHNGGEFVLKRFRGRRCYLQYELEAYSALKDIQGSTVPSCYGVYNRDTTSTAVPSPYGDEDEDTLFLLLQYIRYSPLQLRDLTTSRYKQAQRKAHKSLKEIHSRGVVHNDLRAEKILVRWQGDKVVIVGFGLSLTNPRKYGAYGREDVDKTFLQKALSQTRARIRQ